MLSLPPLDDGEDWVWSRGEPSVTGQTDFQTIEWRGTEFEPRNKDRSTFEVEDPKERRPLKIEEARRIIPGEDGELDFFCGGITSAFVLRLNVNRIEVSSPSLVLNGNAKSVMGNSRWGYSPWFVLLLEKEIDPLPPMESVQNLRTWDVVSSPRPEDIFSTWKVFCKYFSLKALWNVRESCIEENLYRGREE